MISGLTDLTLDFVRGVMPGGEIRYGFMVHYNREKQTVPSQLVGYKTIRSMISNLNEFYFSGDHARASYLIRTNMPVAIIPVDIQWDQMQFDHFEPLTPDDISEIERLMAVVMEKW